MATKTLLVNEQVQLIKDVVTGSRTASNKLYALLKSMVSFTVYKHCFNEVRSDRESMTHDIVVIIFGKLNIFNAERGSLNSFVSTVSRNFIIDEFRKKRSILSLDKLNENGDGFYYQNIPAEALNPEEILLTNEKSNRIQGALDKLQKNELELLLEYAQENISMGNLGMSMGKSADAVCVQVCRIKKKLKKLLLI